MKNNSAKKIMAIVLSILMVFSSMAIATAAVDSSWTAISTADDLKAIANDLSGNYYLTNNITLSGNWLPLGWTDNDDLEFTGTLEGNGFTISGLNMIYSDGGNIGLFAIIGDEGKVQNLNVSFGTISGYCGLGAIAGLNYGTITRCQVTGNTISASANNGKANTGAGGITAANYGWIELCTTSVYNIKANYFAGGIAGENYYQISRCGATCGINKDLNTGSSTPRYYAGGIAGRCNGTINDVYVRNSDIRGTQYVGGLIGRQYNNSKISRAIVDLDSTSVYIYTIAGITSGYGSYGIGYRNVNNSYTQTISYNTSGTQPSMNNGLDLHATSDKLFTKIDQGNIQGVDWSQWANGPDGNPTFDELLVPVEPQIPEEPACDHSEGNYEYNASQHWFVCINDDFTGDAENHTFAPNSHKCTVCDYVSDHVDADKDHACDICGAAMGTHADVNKDHVCDYGCNVAIGDHADTNGDHLCEYCGQPVTDHVDNNGDNHCDICDKFLGTGNGGLGSNGTAHSQDGLKYVYVDNNNHNGVCQTCGEIIVLHEPHVKGELVSNTADCGNDGVATYVCAKCEAVFTVAATADGNHVDADKDHKCDICGAAMGTHAAAEGSHNCAYCGNAVSACVDANKDHKCDVCGAAMGTHAAAAGSHICEYCGKAVSDCVDVDKDHKCDICGADMGEHAAAAGSHNCIYCGDKISDCVDANKDHKCDICGAAMGTHAAAEGSHICEYCGKAVSACVDANKDHKCDVCGAAMGVHADNSADGNCDYCGQPIGGGNTDPVDPPVVDPTDPVDPPVVDPDTCDHVDNDKDGVCDKCHKEFGHVDNDGDNKCDVCGDDMQKHCNCWCHREGKIYKAIYKIMRAFWKLFGINKYCKCGKNHFPTILDLIK